MTKSFVAAVALLLVGATPAHAHRLDEYLQATTISMGKNRVSAQIRLTPGVAVFSAVLGAIDTNADGVISAAEQRAYAERVLRDLSVAIDGDRLALRLVTSKFASVDEMKEGRGDIVIDFDAPVAARGKDRRLTFENRHLREISVYLVNALVPRDADIRVTHQNRNYQQSWYQMDYTQLGTHAESLSLAHWLRIPVSIGLAALLSSAWVRRRRQTVASRANRAVAEHVSAL